MPGLAKDITIGGDGTVWVIGTNPEGGGFGIYRWIEEWQKVEGAPPGAVNIDYYNETNIYITTNDLETFLCDGTKSQNLSIKSRDIAVSYTGQVYCLTDKKIQNGYELV
jgi:hypothetical protein